MSILPVRMNKSFVKIRQLQYNTSIDVDYMREPAANKVYAAEVTIPAQVFYRRESDKARSWTGDKNLSDGHLTVKLSDMTALGITLAKGDLITGMLQQDGSYNTTNLVITLTTPRGHLPVPLIELVYFSERTEQRGSN